MLTSFFNRIKSAWGPPRRANLCYHAAFASRFLPDRHDIIVYVPPQYRRTRERRFPVLYMHDGQNLFDPKTAFGGMDWRVDATADALISTGEIEPLIIVGIYNSGERRIDEYTPSRDPKRGGGRADLYGRMLVEEVIPFVMTEYRTLPDAASTALGGSSLGGLVSLYLGLQYPHIFGKLAVLSPSVWWDDRRILDFIPGDVPEPRTKVWLDIGTQEGQMTLQDARAARDALVRKGWKLGRDLHYQEIEGGTHNEAAWAARVGPVLKYLFPMQPKSETRQELKTVEAR